MNITQFRTRVKSKLLYLSRLDQRLRHWDDERYLKLIYWLRTGERLDLSNPRTFGQKLQWLKLHDRRPEYTSMVDKYEAKRWAAERIGEAHIVPNLGLWDSFEEIDFDALPEQFVLKCTHDSGGLVICKDRAALDLEQARTKIEHSLSRNYFSLGREWPYKDVRPQILAEVYLPAWYPGGETPTTSVINSSAVRSDHSSLPAEYADGVIDYKFYCFHGEPRFLYVSQGLHDHGTAKMDFLTLDWELADFSRSDYRRFAELPPKPVSFDEMIELSRRLAGGIPFVRVDLFEHRGRLLFSEMTFSPVSGMMSLNPKSANLEIGELIDLSRIGTAR